MAKIMEYPIVTTFDANDNLIKDGSNGTKHIKIEDVTSYLNSHLGDPKNNIPVFLQRIFEDFDMSLWGSGSYSVSSGNATTNGKRIRTSLLPNSIIKIKCLSSYSGIVYVNDKNGYAGAWTGDGLTNVADSALVESDFNLLAIALSLPQENAPYSFKFAARGPNGDEDLSVSDSENILFTCITDPSLSRDGIAADAKAVGDFNKPVQNILTDGDVLNRDLFENYNAHGITMTWNEDKTECVVNGTYDGSTALFVNMKRYSDRLPIVPGQKYFVTCDSTDSNTQATIYFVKSTGAYIGQIYLTKNSIIEIPYEIKYNGVYEKVARAKVSMRATAGYTFNNAVVSNIRMQRVFDSNYFEPDDMIAPSNIQSNRFFMLGDMLFLSTTAISEGDALVIGTNCTRFSTAEALNIIFSS